MKKMFKGVLVVGTAALLLTGCESVGVGGASEERITALETELGTLREEFGTFREEWGGFYQDWGTYREEIGLGGTGVEAGGEE